MKRALILLTAVLLTCSSAVALADTHGGTPRAHPALVFHTLNLKQTKLGKILVNTSGSIMFEFTRDHTKKDTCIAIKGCSSVWQPMPTTGGDTAGPGVRRSLISSIKLPASIGYSQITYAGHPLYVFLADATSISYVGTQADGGHWYALSAAGKAVK